MKGPQLALAGIGLYAMMQRHPKHRMLGSAGSNPLQQMSASDFMSEVRGDKKSTGTYLGRDLQAWVEENMLSETHPDPNGKLSATTVAAVTRVGKVNNPVYDEIIKGMREGGAFKQRLDDIMPQFREWSHQFGLVLGANMQRAFADSAAPFSDTQHTIKDYMHKVYLPVWQSLTDPTSYGVSKYKTAIAAVYEAASASPVQLPEL